MASLVQTSECFHPATHPPQRRYNFSFLATVCGCPAHSWSVSTRAILVNRYHHQFDCAHASTLLHPAAGLHSRPSSRSFRHRRPNGWIDVIKWPRPYPARLSLTRTIDAGGSVQGPWCSRWTEEEVFPDQSLVCDVLKVFTGEVRDNGINSDIR